MKVAIDCSVCALSCSIWWKNDSYKWTFEGSRRVNWDQFSMKQILRQSRGCRMFTKVCPWDQCLKKRGEGNKCGQRERWVVMQVQWWSTDPTGSPGDGKAHQCFTELSQDEPRLLYSACISYWMWVVLERGMALSEVTLWIWGNTFEKTILDSTAGD